jgi:hypothetical protein
MLGESLLTGGGFGNVSVVGTTTEATLHSFTMLESIL